MTEQTELRCRWDLLPYLKKLDLEDPKQLEARADEIVGNVRQAMANDKTMPEPGINAYYAPAIERINSADASGDYKREFPQALTFMIESIEME